MKYLMQYRVALLLFAVAFAARLLFLPFSFFDGLPFSPTEHISFDGYEQITTHLLAGDGFTKSLTVPFEPDSDRTPVYPLIIAGVLILTGSYKAFFFLQIIVGSLIPLLGRKLADMLTGNQTIAVGTGLFLALEPLGAWLSTVILTETFFTFFFLIGCIALLLFVHGKQVWWIVLAAATLGVATLIRPTIQFLPFLFSLIFLYKEWPLSRTRIVPIFLFLSIFLLILSPWMYRNERVFGNPSLNVQMASTLYAYLVPSTIALEKNIPYEEASAEFFSREGVRGIEDVNLGNASYFQKRAIHELLQHPRGIIESIGITFGTFFTHDAYRTFASYYPLLAFDAPGLTASDILNAPGKLLSLLFTPGVLLILAGRVMWTGISLLGLMGAYIWMRERKYSIDSLLVALLLFYFPFTTVIIGLAVTGRFRNPINTFLVTMAFFAGMRFFQYLRRYAQISYIAVE